MKQTRRQTTIKKIDKKQTKKQNNKKKAIGKLEWLNDKTR